MDKTTIRLNIKDDELYTKLNRFSGEINCKRFSVVHKSDSFSEYELLMGDIWVGFFLYTIKSFELEGELELIIESYGFNNLTKAKTPLSFLTRNKCKNILNSVLIPFIRGLENKNTEYIEENSEGLENKNAEYVEENSDNNSSKINEGNNESNKNLLIFSLIAVMIIVFVGLNKSRTNDDVGSGSKQNISGFYYMGSGTPGNGNISFIEFKSNGTLVSGNMRNSLINCRAEGNYYFNSNSKSIRVSGIYNSNCPSMDRRNGMWIMESRNIIRSPGGIAFIKN